MSLRKREEKKTREQFKDWSSSAAPVPKAGLLSLLTLKSAFAVYWSSYTLSQVVFKMCLRQLIDVDSLCCPDFVMRHWCVKTWYHLQSAQEAQRGNTAMRSHNCHKPDLGHVQPVKYLCLIYWHRGTRGSERERGDNLMWVNVHRWNVIFTPNSKKKMISQWR